MTFEGPELISKNQIVLKYISKISKSIQTVLKSISTISKLNFFKNQIFSKTEEKYPEVIFQIYISNFQSILPAFREYFHGQFYLH